MKRNRWILYAGLAIILIGVGYGVLVWMNRPMGQVLTLQTPTRVVSEPVTTPVEKTPNDIAATPAATQTSPGTGVTRTCGNTGTMRLLVIGLTTPINEEVLGADAIRLVTINFDQPSATALSLPALLWVDPPAMADLGVEQIQLTTVYMKAYSAAKGDSDQVRAQKATQALAQTIVDNFGYVPDHYITVDDAELVQYVDTLGGVEVNLPKAVDGTSEGYGFYPAGPQLLDGTRTLNFARLFHPGGINTMDVWGNLDRQNLVLKGILAATLKPQNWTKIPNLMKEVRQAVITDLSLDQTLNLACMAKEVGDNIHMLVVGKQMVTEDTSGRLIPDVKEIKRLIVEMESTD